jgi:WhiB family redox-sensing transcriptional regulator
MHTLKGADLITNVLTPEGWRKLPPEDLSWMNRGACRGQDIRYFFPDNDTKHLDRYAAERWCSVCPIKQQCLDYAMETYQKFGTWGGLTAQERQRLRRGPRRRR